MNLGPCKLVVLALVSGGAVPACAAEPPPRPYQDMAKDVLRELIETDTTHAFGSRAAADKIAARLRAAGFPAGDVQVLAERPQKGNVVVRLRGSGKEKPILFLAHL